MDFFGVLSMIGGLALFLFGMHVLGEGLAKVSGGRLEKILETLTSNIFKAVLLGAGVTAVIQSSSATTVMAVGFVNSGIMKLEQAVGIIMGANVGTTATSWILSLTGIEGESFLIQMLKPSSFSPILAIIGVFMMLFSKKERKQDIGSILVGFAVLMTGMDTMSAAVKPLADVPEFTSILTAFSNPILGMIAGTILTAVIQSSSASVGILQALCMTGAVTYCSAIPIIMGQNIGTCVTALLSAIGAKKNAQRTACMHLYFNLIGTVVFMAGFYLINGFAHFSFLAESANPAGIAVVHSLFNIGATLLWLPFNKYLVKLACLTVRDKEEDKEEANQMLQLLDARFLDSPSLAIEHCKRVSNHMAELVKEAMSTSIQLLTNYDEAAAERVVEIENIVDAYEDGLGTYLVKVGSRHLSEKDSHTCSILLQCIGDFERISDHALNIMESAQEVHDKGLAFSPKAQNELAVFQKAVSDILDKTVSVFKTEDMKGAEEIEPLEEVIDYLRAELKKRHVKRLRKGKCTIEMGFVLSDVTTDCERVSDHCSNIAVSIIQILQDGYDTHEYLENMKSEDNQQFTEEYKAYQKMYQLP